MDEPAQLRFEIIHWPRPHVSYSRRFAYHPDRPRERDLVVSFFKGHRRRGMEAFALRCLDNGDHCGFLVVSRKEIAERTSLVIELLFTSYPYRKVRYAGLGEEEPLKVSEYLIAYAISLALDRGHKYLALQPLREAEDRLIPLYQENGFLLGTSPAEDGWMFLTLE